MSTELLMHAHTRKQIEQYLVSPAHALGVNGEVGAGKGYIATYLCSQLLNVSIEDTDQHPYVLKMNALARKTGIDDIRELQKFLMLTVPGTGYIKRVVIVEYIDALGHEAQNALLKTLEEPPEDTVMVATYARSTNILPTIHSRLQRIEIQPVGQAEAERYFQNYSKQEFTKAFFVSGGLIGLLAALLQDQAEHPLIKAINQARSLIGLNRYQRLARVDSIIKDNDMSAALLLDGFYRLVDASYKLSVKTKPNSELKAMAARLRLIEQAISDLDQNVQAKLVMSRLFLEF